MRPVYPADARLCPQKGEPKDLLQASPPKTWIPPSPEDARLGVTTPRSLAATARPRQSLHPGHLLRRAGPAAHQPLSAVIQAAPRWIRCQARNARRSPPHHAAATTALLPSMVRRPERRACRPCLRQSGNRGAESLSAQGCASPGQASGRRGAFRQALASWISWPRQADVPWQAGGLVGR